MPWAWPSQIGVRRPVASSIQTTGRKADSSGRRNTSVMEVFRDGSWQAAEGDVGDAGQDALAGEATGLATRAGSEVLGRDRQGGDKRGRRDLDRGGIRRW